MNDEINNLFLFNKPDNIDQYRSLTEGQYYYQYSDGWFDKIFSLDSLERSLKECCQGTLWKGSVQIFNFLKDIKLREIRDTAYSGTLTLNPLFHTIINERGKERLISSLTIHDRVIQKSINQNYLLPIFTPKLIYDNCASLKLRGTDFAINRLYAHLQKAYSKWGKDFYILKLDMKSYFDSMSHDYIRHIISRYTMDHRIMYYINMILEQYRLDNMINNGSIEPFGVGLGGEVAQTIGIIYLNELDHLFKEYYKIPYVVRYMDDIILIHDDKDYLTNLFNDIINYLSTIHMKLNTKKSVLLNAKDGVVFLKFHFYLGNNIREVYIRPNAKGIKRFKRKYVKMVELFKEGEITDPGTIDQSLNSFIGHISKSDCYEMINYFEQLKENLFSEEIITNMIINRITANNSPIHNS